MVSECSYRTAINTFVLTRLAEQMCVVWTPSQDIRVETPTHLQALQILVFFHFQRTSKAITARRPLLPNRFPKLLLFPTAGCTSDGEGTNSSILPHQRWFHQQGSVLRSSGLLLVTRLHRQRVRTSWPNAGSGRPLHTEPDTTFYFIKH